MTNEDRAQTVDELRTAVCELENQYDGTSKYRADFQLIWEYLGRRDFSSASSDLAWIARQFDEPADFQAVNDAIVYAWQQEDQ